MALSSHPFLLQTDVRDPTQTETLTRERLSELLVSARPGSAEGTFTHGRDSLTRKEARALVMTYLLAHPDKKEEAQLDRDTASEGG